MKTIVISLTTSADRRDHMRQQLEKAGIADFEFFDAIASSTAPVRACMQSHKAVWTKIVQSNEPVIVLEDDVTLHSGFYAFAHDRIPALKGFADVALLGYQVKGNPLWNTFIPHWRCAQVNEHNADFNGAYAYVVMGKAAAQKLLDLTKDAQEHPDLQIMTLANQRKLNLFFMNHPIVQHAGFASTLQHHVAAKSEITAPAPAVQPQIQNPKSKISKPVKIQQQKITLLHPSRGRAQKAFDTYRYWMQAASQQSEIDHVLSIDTNDTEKEAYVNLFKSHSQHLLINSNTCVVEATNQAARYALGNILIYLSDDFKCPENWDIRVLEKFSGIKKPKLLQVCDGINPIDVECLTIPIMNRALYKKLGYFWNPRYKSMFVDNDLYHTCEKNGWLVKAPELTFEHEHWVNKKAYVDETYKRSEANWKQGEKLFKQRQKEGFPL